MNLRQSSLGPDPASTDSYIRVHLPVFALNLALPPRRLSLSSLPTGAHHGKQSRRCRLGHGAVRRQQDNETCMKARAFRSQLTFVAPAALLSHPKGNETPTRQ